MPAPARARRAHFGAPLARFAAPRGASPKAQMQMSACARPNHLGAPLARFGAPRRGLTERANASARRRPPRA
eukprot:4131557-Pyramimonas_sp.AAC.1